MLEYFARTSLNGSLIFLDVSHENTNIWVCLKAVWADINAVVFCIYKLKAQSSTAAEKAL